MRTLLLAATTLALITTLPTATALDPTLTLPGPLPTDGTPTDVHITLDELPPDPVDIRLWLGGDDWQASRTWNGTALERSDRYTQQATGDDTWDAWIPLAANPDSRNHPRLQENTTATLGLRLRTPHGATQVLEEVRLIHEPEHRLVAAGPHETRVAVDEGIVAHRTNPSPEPTVLQVALPPGFDGTVCEAAPCEGLEGLALDRFGSGYARIVNRASSAVSVDTSVVVLEEAVCSLNGSVPAGGRVVVEPGVQRGGSVGAACSQQPGSLPGGVGSLWVGGRVVDVAPERPGWGDVVRDPVSGEWAAWRLPRGVEPEPVVFGEVRGALEVFSTRDRGLEEVVGVIGGARERVVVASYVFTHPVVAEALAGAVERGVKVSAVLEPSPVGGLSGSSRSLVEGLEQRGVAVEWFGGAVGEHGFQHGKVVVVDGCVSLVLTENFTRSGLPVEGAGNVGLGVGVVNASLAGDLEELFGFGGTSSCWRPASWSSFVGRVAVVSSPENAWRVDGVPAWIEGAGALDGLILRASSGWGDRYNPWLEALANASRSSPVRVLASGELAAVREDNRLGLSFLQAHPRAGSVEVRLSGPEVGRVHAKALIGEASLLVGSSNWGVGGGVLNREVNLIVEDAGAAEAARGVFLEAWDPEPPSGLERVLETPGVPVGFVVVSACGAVFVRRR